MTQRVVRVQDGGVTILSPIQIDALAQVADDAEGFSVPPRWLRSEDGTRIVVARYDVQPVEQ